MKDKRSKDLYNGITHIDDELVEAAQARAPRRARPWVKWAVAAACLCFAGAGVFALWRPHGGSAVNHTDVNHTGPIPAQIVAEAQYPDMAPYPGEDGSAEAYEAWYASIDAQRNQPEGYNHGLEGFLTESTRQFLSGADGKNRVYSPLNVYMALAMLAETTGGESRQQILDALGADSIESLRTQARAIWNASYRDDGLTTTRLAGSLWLRDDMTYVQPTMDALAENYYASSYTGQMGSEAFNKALQVWLDQQTGGLLKEQAAEVELRPETILALATTIYFKAPWADEFNKGATTPDVFHSPAGDLTRDFMRQTDTGTVYRGDGFTAVGQHLEGAGAMWLLLPDEGTDPETVLDGDMMAFLLSEKNNVEAADYWADQGYYTIHLSLPKFDVVSDMSLIPGMQALGITDIFDELRSDFTPMTADADQLILSQAKHAARVTADEEGVEAAAFTVLAVSATAMIEMPEDYDFTVDRPFLFAITGQDGLPLFTGIVNEP